MHITNGAVIKTFNFFQFVKYSDQQLWKKEIIKVIAQITAEIIISPHIEIINASTQQSSALEHIVIILSFKID